MIENSGFRICESPIKLSCRLSRDSFIVSSSCFPINVDSKLASLSKIFTCGIPVTLKFLMYFSHFGLSTFRKTKLISFSYSFFIFYIDKTIKEHIILFTFNQLII